MTKIDKVSWGKIKVDQQTYDQVLIINQQVQERSRAKLKQLFGTTHRISPEEQKQLLSHRPEIILIASGWNGVLRLTPEFKDKLKQKGIELKVVLTPGVVKEYNQLVEQGRKINALIHTTC